MFVLPVRPSTTEKTIGIASSKKRGGGGGGVTSNNCCFDLSFIHAMYAYKQFDWQVQMYMFQLLIS